MRVATVEKLSPEKTHTLVYMVAKYLKINFSISTQAVRTISAPAAVSSVTIIFFAVCFLRMDMISNYKNLVSSLERQELESAIHGGSSPQVYGQLLAIYLMMGEL